MEPANRLAFEYPIYGMDLLDDDYLVVAGGGGRMKSGIPNACEVVSFNDKSRALVRTSAVSLEDAPVALATHANTATVVIGSGYKNFSFKPPKELSAASSFEHDVKVHKTQEQSAIAISRNGSRLAIASDEGKLIVLQLPHCDALFAKQVHTQGVTDLSISEDGSLVATTARDKAAYILDAQNGNVVQQIQPVMPKEMRTHVRAIRFAPSQPELIFAAESNPRKGGWISAWQSPSIRGGNWTPIATVRASSDALTAFAVNQSGNIVAVSSSEGHVALFRWSGVSFSRMWTTEPGSFVFKPPAPPHVLPVTAMRFSSSGAHLLTASADYTVAVWPTRRPINYRRVIRIFFWLMSFVVMLFAILMADDQYLPTRVEMSRRQVQPYLEPHLSQLQGIVRPQIREGVEYVQPHIEKAQRAARPHFEALRERAEPLVPVYEKTRDKVLPAINQGLSLGKQYLSKVFTLQRRSFTYMGESVSRVKKYAVDAVAERRKKGAESQDKAEKQEVNLTETGHAEDVEADLATPPSSEAQEICDGNVCKSNASESTGSVVKPPHDSFSDDAQQEFVSDGTTDPEDGGAALESATADVLGQYRSSGSAEGEEEPQGQESNTTESEPAQAERMELPAHASASSRVSEQCEGSSCSSGPAETESNLEAQNDEELGSAESDDSVLEGTAGMKDAKVTLGSADGTETETQASSALFESEEGECQKIASAESAPSETGEKCSSSSTYALFEKPENCDEKVCASSTTASDEPSLEGEEDKSSDSSASEASVQKDSAVADVIEDIRKAHGPAGSSGVESREALPLAESMEANEQKTNTSGSEAAETVQLDLSNFASDSSETPKRREGSACEGGTDEKVELGVERPSARSADKLFSGESVVEGIIGVEDARMAKGSASPVGAGRDVLITNEMDQRVWGKPGVEEPHRNFQEGNDDQAQPATEKEESRIDKAVFQDTEAAPVLSSEDQDADQRFTSSKNERDGESLGDFMRENLSESHEIAHLTDDLCAHLMTLIDRCPLYRQYCKLQHI